MQPKAIIRCRLNCKADALKYGPVVRVAVCNGIEKASDLFCWNLKAVLDSYGDIAVFRLYEDEKALLEKKQEQDIIFYMLRASAKDAFEAVGRLRKRYKNSKVIFVAENGTYVKEAYKVQPFRFLYLSDSKEEIEEALFSAIHSLRERKGLALEGDRKYYYILLKDIIYIEALGDEIGIFTTEGNEYIIRMPLKQMFFLIGDDFIRLNRQQIVNARYIENMESARVMLVNQEEVLISGRERRNVAERYAEYVWRTTIS